MFKFGSTLAPKAVSLGLLYSATVFFGFGPIQADAYDLVREYSGISFFDRWDFYGHWDNLTLGDVWWLSREQAFSQKLAYVNEAGNVIIKVDDVSDVPFNEKRNSVRITTQDKYAVGSLWIIDIMHLPYGCSVWPAFWSKGDNWPQDGEIDIIEGINQQLNNQMALHTTPGCMATPVNGAQSGAYGEKDCSTPSGCLVIENKPNSYREGFSQNGGGVWATQFDVQGIFIWFWSRKDVPNSIKSATSTSGMNMSDWGPPSASYPANGCNITQYFRPQNLVLDITLCGIWAALPNFYAKDCGSSGPTGVCYPDNVPGAGSRFSEAYFEIPYLRAYTTGAVAPTPTARVVSPPTEVTPVLNEGGSGNGGRRGDQPTSLLGQSTQTDGPRLRPSPLFYPGNGAASRHINGHFLVPLFTTILIMTFYGLFA